MFIFSISFYLFCDTLKILIFVLCLIISIYGIFAIHILCLLFLVLFTSGDFIFSFGGFWLWAYVTLMGFPVDSVSEKSACNMGNLGFHPWVGEILRKVRLPTLVFLTGESPSTEEPGGPVHGVKRVRHDWANEAVKRHILLWCN